jgi:REP element-mobilizing transposase RayT
VIAVDVARQVMQPGNGRRFILDTEADRKGYFDLLRHHLQEKQMSALGYYLMSNHVHRIVVSGGPEPLTVAMKLTHGRYTSI